MKHKQELNENKRKNTKEPEKTGDEERKGAGDRGEVKAEAKEKVDEED